ncbi:MAG: hypothetical protein KC505_04735 [Myxococcales bacterium]|nr:hypothetical protein [Myxococcales bacterium]USN49801.1 MAG: hypothetical protein H6731_05830 [Myxococcales bacterium]
MRKLSAVLGFLIIYYSNLICAQNDAGAQAVGSIVALPIITTFCPCYWPFGIVTSAGVGATTSVAAMGGGATSSTTTSGISTSGTSSTTVNLNHGDIPFTGKNCYEFLEELQHNSDWRITEWFFKNFKNLFLSPESLEAWDEYWADRKQKKRDKKEAKKQEKQSKKNKKNQKSNKAEQTEIEQINEVEMLEIPGQTVDENGKAVSAVLKCEVKQDLSVEELSEKNIECEVVVLEKDKE